MRQRKQLRERKPSKQSGLGSMARGVVGVVVLLAVLFTAQIFLAGKVATLGGEIYRLEKEKDELALQNARLKARINKVSSLSLIEQKARDELKMVDAQGKIVYLKVPSQDYFASAPY